MQTDRVILEVPASKGRIYICGPMTGYPNYNYDLFHQAEQAWIQQGWNVKNPARNFGGRQDLPYETYIKQALVDVMNSDAVAVLPHWNRSKGALTELHVALTLGMPVYYAMTGMRDEIPLAEIGWWTYKKDTNNAPLDSTVRQEVLRKVHPR